MERRYRTHIIKLETMSETVDITIEDVVDAGEGVNRDECVISQTLF